MQVNVLFTMKIITFFSVKGGTGKTTFNIMLASYLAYELNKRVLYLDLDAPEYNSYGIRQRELATGSGCSTLYPLEKVDDCSVESMRKLAKKLSDLNGMVDYVVMDFAGSLDRNDPIIQMALTKVLDIVVIPTESESQALSSAKSLSTMFNSMNQSNLIFFNKVQSRDSAEMYNALAEWFKSKNVRVSDHRIKQTDLMRRDSEGDRRFIRSSICFPSKDIQKVNPAIIELFNEIIMDNGN